MSGLSPHREALSTALAAALGCTVAIGLNDLVRPTPAHASLAPAPVAATRPEPARPRRDRTPPPVSEVDAPSLGPAPRVSVVETRSPAPAAREETPRAAAPAPPPAPRARFHPPPASWVQEEWAPEPRPVVIQHGPPPSPRAPRSVPITQTGQVYRPANWTPPGASSRSSSTRSSRPTYVAMRQGRPPPQARPRPLSPSMSQRRSRRHGYGASYRSGGAWQNAGVTYRTGGSSYGMGVAFRVGDRHRNRRGRGHHKGRGRGHFRRGARCF